VAEFLQQALHRAGRSPRQGPAVDAGRRRGGGGGAASRRSVHLHSTTTVLDDHHTIRLTLAAANVQGVTSSAETSPSSDQPVIALEDFKAAIDRDAEIPIGVQLAWALRAYIQAGRLQPGQRLPGLRELAEVIGVNINTVRSVYQRLDREGLID